MANRRPTPVLPQPDYDNRKSIEQLNRAAYQELIGYSQSVNSIITDLTALDARVTAAEADITTLEGDMTAVEAEVDALQDDVLPVGMCQLVLDGSSLRLNRYKGHKLFINGALETIPSTGPTLATTGLSTATVYYIYAYMNSGTMTLEASTTTRATDSTYGHQIKNGDATRTLVGLIRTNNPLAFTDALTARWVRSWFNDTGVTLAGTGTTANTTNANLTEVDSNARIHFVCWSHDIVDITLQGTFTDTGGSNSFAAAPGIDGATHADTVECGANNDSGANFRRPLGARLVCKLSEGYHFGSAMLRSVGGGTASFNTTSGARLLGRVGGNGP